MELRDWLTAVALRNGSTPGNARHYHGFASNIRKDFPRFPFGEATAHAVGGDLCGQFPTWDELREAIRAVVIEANDGKPKTEEARMTALWVGFYHRKLREEPRRQWHFLSLLRKVDMNAFKEVDDGFWARSETEFDQQFWGNRGGHPGHMPHDGVGVPKLRHIALPPNHRSHAAPAEPKPTPKPRPLDADHLAQARQRAGIPSITP